MPATNTTSQATSTVRRRRTATLASFARRPDLCGTACGDGIGCWAAVAMVLVIERSLTSVVPATVWTAGLASHRENRQVRRRQSADVARSAPGESDPAGQRCPLAV